MISSWQIILVLFAVAIVSCLSAGILFVLDYLDANHQHRLQVIKINILLVWSIITMSITLILVHAHKTMNITFIHSDVFAQSAVSKQVQNIIVAGEKNSFLQIVVAMYILGVCVCLLRFVFSFLEMRKILLTSSKTVIHSHVIRTSDCVNSPFSFGFFCPQIFIPTNYMSEVSDQEMQVILKHEATHIKNRDPQWKLFSLVTRAILFFNPIYFYLHQKMDLEMEIKCDQETIRSSNISVEKYGNILIKAILEIQSSKPNPMLTYLSKTNLRKRVLAMKTQTFPKPILSFLCGSLLLISGVVAVAAVSGVQKAKRSFAVHVDILVNGHLVASPQIVTMPNESATLESKSENSHTSLRMQVLANDSDVVDSHDAIDLKLAVDYKSNTEFFHTQPHLLVSPGEESRVTYNDSGNNLELVLRAERK